MVALLDATERYECAHIPRPPGLLSAARLHTIPPHSLDDGRAAADDFRPSTPRAGGWRRRQADSSGMMPGAESSA